MSAPGIVGRDAELDRIDAFLKARATSFGALLIEGEPGSGKTSLWEAALPRAGDRIILACRPVEAEAKLSFVGLADLLKDTAAGILTELPAPQREALEGALLRDDVRGRHDHRAIGAGTISALKALASARPVVVAIDDLQWLDRPSARALGFALRRLSSEPVAFLATRRSDPSVPLLMLEAALRGHAVEHLRLGPLTMGALGRVLDERLGLRFSRTTLLRVLEVSRGNPFHALELARALEASGRPLAPGEPLPVPEDLQTLLLDRVRRLPSSTRWALLFAALLSRPAEDDVARAFGDGWAKVVASLDGSDVADVWAGSIRFSHPLMASTVLSSVSADDRRRAHRRLGETIEDEELRAWHLALATVGPDERVAAALEEASRSATSRGAPDAAADLAELAASLTADERSSDRCRRLILAGDARFAVGDTELAEERFRDAQSIAPPGKDAADALLHVGRMRVYRGDIPEARRLLQQALSEAEEDAVLLAVIHADLAFLAAAVGDTSEVLLHAGPAAELAERTDQRHIVADARAQSLAARFVQGGGVDRAAIDRVLADEEWSAHHAGARPSETCAYVLMLIDEFDAARSVLDRCELATSERGLDAQLPFVWSLLSELDCWTGDWQRGLTRALEADRLAVDMGQGVSRSITCYAVALLAAHLGRVEEARNYAQIGLADATSRGASVPGALNVAVMGFLDASLGRWAEAAAILAPLVDLARAAGIEEPAILWALPELIESLIAQGKLERAEALTTWLGDGAQAIDRPRGLASAARSRALLAAATGSFDEAFARCDEALAQHSRIQVPFERARTLLVRGQIARRARKWGIARESLNDALSEFERLGAVLWVERARDELSRVGGRTAPRWELTENERRVAELVATGRSNKEVAEILFVSPKTVSATLGRVYRKLGVASRGRLAAHLKRED